MPAPEETRLAAGTSGSPRVAATLRPGAAPAGARGAGETPSLRGGRSPAPRGRRARGPAGTATLLEERLPPAAGGGGAEGGGARRHRGSAWQRLRRQVAVPRPCQRRPRSRPAPPPPGPSARAPGAIGPDSEEDGGRQGAGMG